jgi:hypothetical protein
MPIRKSASSGAAPGFSISVNGETDAFMLGSTLPAGGYEVSSSSGTSIYDIYALTDANTLVGYTNGLVLNVQQPFSKISILGVASDTFIFTYKGEVASAEPPGEITSAAAYISSISVSSVPNIDDSFIISGGNFASDVVVLMLDQQNIEHNVKSTVRLSSTSLLVVRPDNLPVTSGPYSVKVYNPGVQQPEDSNAHILTNSMSPGTLPSWITQDKIYWNFGSTTTQSINLSATDTENSNMTYGIVSGTLPLGLSLNSQSGVISGPIDQSVVGGTVSTITFRVTDAGGNFVNKQISLYANNGPSWSSSGTLTSLEIGSVVNTQLQATSKIVPTTLTFSIVSGTLPGGVSMSSSGLITGTYNGTPGTNGFTVRVTDAQGLYTDRMLSIGLPRFVKILSSSSWTVPTGVTSIKAVVAAGGGGGGGGVNGGGGGGGAGGVIIQDSISVVPGESLTAVVGAGGAKGTNNGVHGSQGAGSSLSGSLFSITTVGGGYGSGQAQVNGGNGGSGGGTTGYTNYGQQPGSGTAGQGNAGGPNTAGSYATGGGGKGAIGGANANSQSGSGGAGIDITSYAGTATAIAGGGGGGGGYSAYSNGAGAGSYGGGAAGAYASNAIDAAATSASGGGGGSYNNIFGSSGGSGVVYIKYYG